MTRLDSHRRTTGAGVDRSRHDPKLLERVIKARRDLCVGETFEVRKSA